jgi:transposase
VRQDLPPVEHDPGAEKARLLAPEGAALPPEEEPGGARGLQKGGLADQVAAIATQHPDKRIELWFSDEARVGNKGRVCHRWWRRGERPPGVQQLGYLWAARHCPRTNGGQGLAFTAVRPATGEDVTLVLPTVNTAAMQVFLDQVAASRPTDVHLAMVLDGAGWHVSRDLAVPPNITLVVLPPYAPELNPVERIWLYLRERFLSLRLLHSTDDIIDACCDAWMRLVAEPDRIKSLCNYPWIEKVAS